MSNHSPDMLASLNEAFALLENRADVVEILKAILEKYPNYPITRSRSIIEFERDQLMSGRTNIPDGQVLMPKLMTQKEVAPWIKKSEAWLERCRWAKEGIPYLKLNRSVRYKAEDVSEWLERNRHTFTED